MPALLTQLLTQDVDVAVARLLDGGLVGLPTETVYGLAADADSPPAVARVYAAKGRPADHPLIVHVTGAEALDPGPGAWVRDVPEYAVRLAHTFWPGPLTLVLPRTARAGDHLTGGQDTVALRAPAHPLAQAVIRGLAATAGHLGGAVAAPSANRFGRVSPTTAAHVADELAGVLVPGRDCILDGGPSRVGVESTIVDCTGPAPVVLRPGAVGADDVARVGGVPVAAAARSTVRAPGMLASHYAPRARVVLAAHEQELADQQELTDGHAPTDPPSVGLLAQAGIDTPPGVVRLSAPADAQAFAQVLYSALREADALGLTTVIVVPPTAGPADDSDRGLVDAIVDRLQRAAADITGRLDHSA